MAWKQWILAGVIGVAAGIAPCAKAGDLKISLPRRGHLTPVQRLNRDGVEALNKHNYEKAESFFYKAYLLDPDDPFTLNNLGYISELQGQVDRAQKFYALAAQQPTDAVIDRASSKRVEGQSINEALAVADAPMQINHENVEAVRLLSQGRAPEADLLLQKSLKRDANNIFTLNNMGVAKEMEGESQEALKYYDAATGAHSDATAVVTLSRSWRGKPVSEMATQNAKNLRGRLETQQSTEAKLAEMNLRGVSAMNRNDLKAAETAFRAAYALDPYNAFALNNIGYLAEIEGDRETAQFFYDKAQTAAGANVAVGLATRKSVEGMKLAQVASGSDSKVETRMSQERAALRGKHEPVVLQRRDGSVVEEHPAPAGISEVAPR